MNYYVANWALELYGDIMAHWQGCVVGAGWNADPGHEGDRDISNAIVNLE